MTTKLSVIGYPRIGAHRELKKEIEAYFTAKIPRGKLLETAAGLRHSHWSYQQKQGIDFIPSNDFSFYDSMLDTAILMNVIPERYRRLGLDQLDTYFAMAKGYQKQSQDVKALPMKKWFNTNYHYIVPSLEEGIEIKLNGNKIFTEYKEALALGIETKPVLIGPFTFLKLSLINSNVNRKYYFPACAGTCLRAGTHRQAADRAEMITRAYQEIFNQFNALKAQWIQIDEPALVTDLKSEELILFKKIYQELLSKKHDLRILLQTYFGDVDDAYQTVIDLNFDGIGLDFVEGRRNLNKITTVGFPSDKILFAGLVNGKNVWINDYRQTLETLDFLAGKINRERIVLSTSCSLLHIPYSLKYENRLTPESRQYLTFAEEKLAELREIAVLWDATDYRMNSRFVANASLIAAKKDDKVNQIPEIRKHISDLTESDFTRKPSFSKRSTAQRTRLNLPLLPTTTIGSFPQTPEIRKLRRSYRDGKITAGQYNAVIREKISAVIRLQEEIGLDVLVHGEYERNDMVEYFGENLSGFLFTENGWVQSYGTRCVKPPIIFGDVCRTKSITVENITYAQSLTKKPVKGMLTGPVTILNWSFPREDLPPREIAYQIGLAIRQEVLDLEAAGIQIIQIDEAAFREKLPLRKTDWNSYFDWAIRAFRLTNAAVRPETQIHTHMCYSEFETIINEIADLDADVFTFEAARSDLSILDALKSCAFPMQTGPGVYDIHSPRVPGKEEIRQILRKMLLKIDQRQLWVNPDCGLKTRNMEEVIDSLKNMVAAAREVREELQPEEK